MNLHESQGFFVANVAFALDKAKVFGLSETTIGTLTDIDSLVTAIEALTFTEQDQTPVLEQIRRSIAQGRLPVQYIDTPFGLAATPLTSAGSLADATYYFRVSAIDGDGNEGLACAQVSAVVSGGSGSGRVTLDWDDVEGASSYRIYVSTTTNVYAAYKTSTTSSLNYTVTTGTSAGTIPTAAAGKVGIINDIDVATAAAASSGSRFTTLRNLVGDRHPLGTTFRERVGDMQT